MSQIAATATPTAKYNSPFPSPIRHRSSDIETSSEVMSGNPTASKNLDSQSGRVPLHLIANTNAGSHAEIEHQSFPSTFGDIHTDTLDGELVRTVLQNSNGLGASSSDESSDSDEDSGNDFHMHPIPSGMFIDGISESELSNDDEKSETELELIDNDHATGMTPGNTRNNNELDHRSPKNDGQDDIGPDSNSYDGDISHGSSSDDNIPCFGFYNIPESDDEETEDECPLGSGKKPELTPIWVQYPKREYPRFDLGLTPTISDGSEAVLASRAYPMPQPGSRAVDKQVWVIVSNESFDEDDDEDNDDEAPAEYINHS
ncbi:hypothetical protein ACHAQA_000218 [Verticillium albo-atrum]